jgi:hypothetical protein
MEDNQPNREPILDEGLREEMAQIRKRFEAFYQQIEETIQDPTVENLTRMRDQVFENGEKEFELGSLLSKIVHQSQAEEEDFLEPDEPADEDMERADDQELYLLIDEAFTILKDSSDLLVRTKKYRKHILLELDEYGELPRALSGLHDALIEKLEKIVDVTGEF